LWHLWISRNKAVFQLTVPHPTLESSKDKVIDVPYTCPNWRGFYKLNTDAAWKRGQAAGGAVVQGDEGSWVSGFSIKFKAISPEEAELVAIKHGLRFVEELQIEVEFDAKQIYNLLIEKRRNVEIRHIPRDNNVVAHGLASFGMVMKHDEIVHRLLLIQFEMTTKLTLRQSLLLSFVSSPTLFSLLHSSWASSITYGCSYALFRWLSFCCINFFTVLYWRFSPLVSYD
ncbi:hypothetical protein RDABS01_039850, partial [Bienertia sinuspersici]